MLNDPFLADPFAVVPHQRRPSTQSNDPNSQVSPWTKFTRTPHVHLTDEADKYFVEAEVPGVPKENLDVSISDNGRSLTIKGNTFTSSEPEPTPEHEETAKEPVAAESQSTEQAPKEQPAAAEGAPTNPSDAPESKQGTQQSQPRWSTRSSFERTIWLPKPVDAQKVVARLDSGILTLEIPKLQAQAHRITIA
ncbi:hypothetical protein FRB90_003579 [Tulasnella sp. 427]|nr:hypothetical protein FRB90_003579 [Tulasnella sp. 427]